jgi:aryl-alcohol dehydrogenase-like predicted oxidoreductase
MQFRKLGTTDIDVSLICLGTDGTTQFDLPKLARGGLKAAGHPDEQ